jgi:predicted aspartyl protease
MRMLLCFGLLWHALGFAADCKFVRIDEWPIRLERGVPVLDGQINGQKVAILLDTGTLTSFVPRSAANRLGLVRQESPAAIELDPRGGSTLETTRIDELKIGPAARKNWNLPVVGAHDFGTTVSLVLGADFFTMADVEFDLPGNAVRLFQATKDCQGVSLAYWARGGASMVPLERESGIFFQVSVNGRAMRATLDSGAEFSALNAAEAERMGFKQASPGVALAGCSIGVGRKPVDYWAGRFESFVIGDERIGSPTLRFADLFKDSTFTEASSRLPNQVAGLPQMLVGTDFLRAHRVLIARSQGRMYFTYAGGTVFQPGAAKGCRDLR